MTRAPRVRASSSGQPRGVRTILAALAVTALALLAGCSDDVRAAPPQPTPMGPKAPSGNPTPETWVAEICTALTPAVRPAAPVPEVRTDDLLGTRQRMLTYLDARIAAYDAAADGINEAGPPPVEAGQMVTAPVLDVVRQRSSQLTSLRERLQAVPAVADSTLIETLQRVRGGLVLAGPAVSLPDLALPPSLTAQAAGVPSCRAIGIGVPS